MRKILTTSALPYANGDIHLGHLVEYIQTDIWVRFQKLRGNKAIYICADDTHGTAIMIRAAGEGRTEQQLIEEMSTFSRRGNSWMAEDGCNDDLMMCLVIFGWLSNQQYFKELSNSNIRNQL